MNPFQIILIFLGRICLSLIFILAALDKIIDYSIAEQHFVERLSHLLGSVNGIEWLEILIDYALSYSYILIWVAIGIELVGGILLFLGLKVRLACALLILFLIPATIVMHHFWNLQGGEKDLQTVMFLKNIALLGGLFIAEAYGGKLLSSKGE